MTVLLGPTPCHRCGEPVTVVQRPFAFEAPAMAARPKQRRLSLEQADAIRQRRRAGEIARVLAAEFGISKAAVYAIGDNRSYRRTMVESETLTETVPLSAVGERHVCEP